MVRITTVLIKYFILNYLDSTIPSLWSGGAKYGVIMFEPTESDVSSQVILDLSEILQQLKSPLAITKVEINAHSSKLMKKLNVPDSGGLVIVDSSMVRVDTDTVDVSNRAKIVSAVKNFVWKHSADFALQRDDSAQLSDAGKDKKEPVKKAPVKTASRKEMMTRRYRAHMSDLEKTVVYAISHEVSQHSSISGQSLAALHQLVTVLDKYFPGRIEMTLMLRQLRSWVTQHQDTVRGEDLGSWFNDYLTQHGLLVSDHWLGCAGSAGQQYLHLFR